MNNSAPTATAPTPWPRLDQVIDEIRSIIDSSETIACLAHKDADADSLGSALAFAIALREQGKHVVCMVPDPLPHMISHLPGFDTVSPAPAHIDALFTFDCAMLGRFGEKRHLVETIRPVVNVDHHVSNEGFGTINLVDPTASATGEVVFHLLAELGVAIPADAATNLYAALLTDTGGFRHDNTTEAALRLGADLVGLGANPAWVALKSYNSRSANQVKLEGMAIAAMAAECDGALIWSTVTQAMLEQSGAGMAEAEGIVDQLQSIASMRVAVLIKEVAADCTRISVRTRGDYDGTLMCAPFGGGGHKRAAGAELAMPISTAIPLVLDEARKLLGATNGDPE